MGQHAFFIGDARLAPLVELEEYKTWVKRAERTRYNRNRYLHGRWAFLWHLEKPVEFVSPIWMRDKLGSDGYERMTLEEFEVAVDELRECSKEFINIREKHQF